MEVTAYFDAAATTPVLPAAREALLAALEAFGNPSARHRLGKEAELGVQAARQTVAQALGCGPGEVYFTSGGTEGDNWAVSYASGRGGGHIITSAVEHAAVREPIRALQQKGYEVTWLPVDSAGQVSPQALAQAVRPDTLLISLMLVNNETGTRQPVEECARLAKAKAPNVFFHTDAVQGFLKTPFTVKELGVDALTISGHKLGAPKGVGALYLRAGSRLRPLLLGGGQEGGLRSGTESTALIAALGAAVAYHLPRLEEELAHLTELRQYAVERLFRQVPGLEPVGRGDAPHILAVTLPGYKSEVVVRYLSDRGIFLSSGSACHKGKPSHVYAALGLTRAQMDGALRISLLPTVTREEIDALAEGLREARETLFPSLS